MNEFSENSYPHHLVKEYLKFCGWVFDRHDEGHDIWEKDDNYISIPTDEKDVPYFKILSILRSTGDSIEMFRKLLPLFDPIVRKKPRRRK